jgi:alpha-tubulin suppressor-like RCC1 family protein
MHDGQLGHGNKKDRSNAPVEPLDLSCVVDLAAGERHACAVTKRGAVSCWGAGKNGQLGSGHANRRKPAVVPGVTEVVDVEAGRDHTCARKRDGSVICWGGETHVQTGNQPGKVKPPPTAIRTLTGAQQLSAGGQHTCAVKSGTVMCWGDNARGQLGNAAGARTLTPQLLPGPVKGLTDAVDVVAGTTHTCARRATGQVVCWGDGTRGQLGAGIQGYWTTRVPVKGLSTVTDLSVGSDLTCAKLTTGDLRCWGTAGTGFFPTGTKFDTPIAVRTPRGMRQIALGATHACALRTDGKVECWGDDTFGQLGEGVLAYAEVPTPVKGLYSAS